MSLPQILIIIGLFTNLLTLSISIWKFKILSNVLLLNWKAVTAGLTFAFLTFSVWFAMEIMELVFFSTFDELFGYAFEVTIFSLLICTQAIFSYALLKGVLKK